MPPQSGMRMPILAQSSSPTNSTAEGGCGWCPWPGRKKLPSLCRRHFVICNLQVTQDPAKYQSTASTCRLWVAVVLLGPIVGIFPRSKWAINLHLHERRFMHFTKKHEKSSAWRLSCQTFVLRHFSAFCLQLDWGLQVFACAGRVRAARNVWSIANLIQNSMRLIPGFWYCFSA